MGTRSRRKERGAGGSQEFDLDNLTLSSFLVDVVVLGPEAFPTAGGGLEAALRAAQVGPWNRKAPLTGLARSAIDHLSGAAEASDRQGLSSNGAAAVLQLVTNPQRRWLIGRERIGDGSIDHYVLAGMFRTGLAPVQHAVFLTAELRLAPTLPRPDLVSVKPDVYPVEPTDGTGIAMIALNLEQVALAAPGLATAARSAAFGGAVLLRDGSGAMRAEVAAIGIVRDYRFTFLDGTDHAIRSKLRGHAYELLVVAGHPGVPAGLAEEFERNGGRVLRLRDTDPTRVPDELRERLGTPLGPEPAPSTQSDRWERQPARFYQKAGEGRNFDKYDARDDCGHSQFRKVRPSGAPKLYKGLLRLLGDGERLVQAEKCMSSGCHCRRSIVERLMPSDPASP